MNTTGEQTLRMRALEFGQRAFGHSWEASQWAVGPGRLELLGNHVDYNGGLVLAGAIDRAVIVGIATTGDSGHVSFIAGDIGPDSWTVEIAEVGDWKASDESGPRAYALGVIAALGTRGIGIRDGLQLSIAGNVPVGFGMSSSAGLCVALVLALAEETPEARESVLIAQDAEHRAGAPVGAMDQSASVAGGIIIFDGTDISFRRIDPDLGSYVFAVADSRVEHSNASSSYPVRVRESQEALCILRARLDPDLSSLGAISSDQWDVIAASGTTWLNETLLKRTRHVVTEMERVRQGIRAVEDGDWGQFGELMQSSGRSSAIDYEISHPRVEELVRDVSAVPGVLGARMMGGGEGGPALALLHRDAIPDVAATLTKGYFARYPAGDPADRFQVCVFSEGAHLTSGSDR